MPNILKCIKVAYSIEYLNILKITEYHAQLNTKLIKIDTYFLSILS